MTHHAKYSGGRVPDFVPDAWLFEFESDARTQVHVVPPVPGRQGQPRWGPNRVCGVAVRVVVVAVSCVVSIVAAAMVSPALVLWLAGGFWFLAAVGLSVWAGSRADALVDSAARW